MLTRIKTFARTTFYPIKYKPAIDNQSVMTSFVPHITSVNRHGKDWLCMLKNGFRLRVSDALMTTVAQSGK